MKPALMVLLASISLNAQAPAAPVLSDSQIPNEVRLKAATLVEMSGGRDRLIAALPGLVELGKAQMQKQCPDCDPAFFTEWGNRMVAKIKVDDFLNIAALAYARRFRIGELTEIIAVVTSQKSEKPVSPSPALQKKLAELLPAILGEINGGCTELGARLGIEAGNEIQKEHPEFTKHAPAPPDKPDYDDNR